MCCLKETPQRPGRSEEAAQGKKTTAVAFLGFLFTVYWYNLCDTSKLSPFPAQQHYRIASKAISRSCCGLGKILCLLVGLGESYNSLQKQTREIWAGDAAVGAATTVFAQRPPELCPIQLHSMARGGLFSRGRDRCQNTGGSGEECFVVCQNEF